MTAGLWIVLASVVLAGAVGGWRLFADGRFRGTHRLKQQDPPEVGVRGAQRRDPPEVEVRGAQRRASKPRAGNTEPLLPADQLGERATLLQFSSAFCAPCRATRRVLEDAAGTVPGVTHVEVDAEQHLDLVRRAGVLRTPTTLVLDAHGEEVSRASGAPRKEHVLSALWKAVLQNETRAGEAG